MDQVLHDELLRMQCDDQRVREQYLQCPAPDDDPQTLAILDEILRINARNVAPAMPAGARSAKPPRSPTFPPLSKR